MTRTAAGENAVTEIARAHGVKTPAASKWVQRACDKGFIDELLAFDLHGRGPFLGVARAQSSRTNYKSRFLPGRVMVAIPPRRSVECSGHRFPPTGHPAHREVLSPSSHDCKYRRPMSVLEDPAGRRLPRPGRSKLSG